MKPRVWLAVVPSAVLEREWVPVSTVRIGKHSYVLEWGDITHNGRRVSLRGANSTVVVVVRPGERWIDVLRKAE